MFQDIGKLLILTGLFLVLFGVLFVFRDKIPFLGKLPGDIVVEKKQFSFYFPLVTCIVISAGLTLLINVIIWLFRK
jgi:hypothetical protein